MADVPINIVNLNVPFEDEPGAGDPTPAINMGPMLEAVRNIGQAVTQINGNIRAILETLRTIARSGVRGGGGGGRRGGGRGASAGGEDDPIRKMRETQRQRLYMARRGISLAMTGEEVAMHRGDVLPPTGSEGFYGSFFSVIDRNAAATSRQEAQGIRKAQREEQARQREQRRQEAREQRESLRAAQRRMTSGQANRIDELRRMVGSRTGLNYTDEELSLLSGQASPSGLPGTRAFSRSLHSLNARAAVHGPALPPPPGVPAPATPQNPLAAVMGVFNTVRSILGIIGKIGAVIGLVTLIAKILSKMSQATERQRENLSRIDPVYAMMEANLMISRLRADIAVAKDPALRTNMQHFTNAQIARSQAQIPLRIASGQISSAFGTAYEEGMLGIELVLGGMLTGNSRNIGLGAGIMSLTAAQFSGGGGMFSLFQMFKSILVGQVTAQSRATTNGLFMDDFERLSGPGRGANWIRDKAYTGNRNAANWWR
jgi:hypothetical protein